MRNIEEWTVLTYKDVEEMKKEEAATKSNHIDNNDAKSCAEKSEIKENIFESNKVNLNKEKSEKSFGFFYHTDLTAKPYWVRNIFPVLLEATYLIMCFTLPSRSLVYTNFGFFFILFVYYFITRGFSFKNFQRNLKSGSQFWIHTLTCILFYGIALAFTDFLGHFIPSIDAGYYQYKIDNIMSLIMFSLTSIFFGPIVEEVFYRSNLISMDSKSIKIITVIISTLLYAIIHSYSITGILAVSIWALPFIFVYLKTRNIYVVITAHIIVNMIGHIPIIIQFFAE